MHSKVLIPGVVIEPVAEVTIIKEPHRVLYVDNMADIVVLIPIEPSRYVSRIFFRGYKVYKFSKLIQEFDATEPKLRIVDVKPRAITLLNDELLDRKYRRKSQQSSALRLLNERWNLIKPLLSLEPSTLFNRKLLLESIKTLTEANCQNHTDANRKIRHTITSLNQYWAGGSLRSALIPFHNLCGGQGKQRIHTGAKLGRPNRPTQSGIKDKQGFICDEQAIQIMQFCWRNFLVRNVTVAKACRRMWREFYSQITIQEDGKTIYELLPVNQRPTQTQFRYWGQKQAPNQAAWKRQLAPRGYQRNWRALCGSANDDVVAVGQRAAVDSTPPDLHLVSVLSRLKRIGGAYRIIIVDALYGYIPGFYLGIEAPSSNTVKLAFLHAMSDKTLWLTDLGLDLPADDWIPISFTQAIADNTDLRTDEVQTALHSIGTSIMFVPKFRSDMNSQAESSYHSMHRAVDHNLAGSTYGRKTERGESSADIRARHTIVEAIRETARAIHAHNTCVF